MGEMTDNETRELLTELLRVSVREAMDAAIQSLGSKVHNTPEGRSLLAEALSKQLSQRGLTMGQMRAVFALPEFVPHRVGYHVVTLGDKIRSAIARECHVEATVEVDHARSECVVTYPNPSADRDLHERVHAVAYGYMSPACPLRVIMENKT